MSTDDPVGAAELLRRLTEADRKHAEGVVRQAAEELRRACERYDRAVAALDALTEGVAP